MEKIESHKIEKKKTKIKFMSVIRMCVQILFFIFLPALFVSVFNAFKDIYVAVITLTFTFESFAKQIFLLIAIIPVTVLMGRFFCGFMCSFGALGDLFWFISRKLFKFKFRVNEKADRILKYIKYVLLLGIVILIWSFAIIQPDAAYSPWTIFGIYSSLGGWQNLTYLLSIGSFVLLAIIILSVFIQRFFCRYLCPLGAIYALLSHFRLFRIRKPRETCKSCRLCSTACPMGIPTYKYDVIKSDECINCFICTSNCIKKNAKADAIPALATAAALAAITGLYYTGNITYAKMDKPSQSVTTEAPSTTGQFTDGAYSGYAYGYKGKTYVDVIISNGNISYISVTSTSDDMEFFQKAEENIINGIIGTQSFDIPTVSGATFSSNAIINAVKNALDNTFVPPDITQAETEQIPIIEDPVLVNDQLVDGTYSGSATGFSGKIYVEVTVKDGKMENISVISHVEDLRYFNKAYSSIINAIIETQNPIVKTVSGATYTSKGLMNAVADALNNIPNTTTDIGN